MSITELISKIRTDEQFASKYSTLRSITEIVTQANADGYNITEEDAQNAICTVPPKSCKLDEEDLEGISGGGDAYQPVIATEDRHNADECRKHSRVRFDCVGFLALFHCTHYRNVMNTNTRVWRKWCVKGYYDYTEK